MKLILLISILLLVGCSHYEAPIPEVPVETYSNSEIPGAIPSENWSGNVTLRKFYISPYFERGGAQIALYYPWDFTERIYPDDLANSVNISMPRGGLGEYFIKVEHMGCEPIEIHPSWTSTGDWAGEVIFYPEWIVLRRGESILWSVQIDVSCNVSLGQSDEWGLIEFKIYGFLE